MSCRRSVKDLFRFVVSFKGGAVAGVGFLAGSSGISLTFFDKVPIASFSKPLFQWLSLIFGALAIATQIVGFFSTCINDEDYNRMAARTWLLFGLFLFCIAVYIAGALALGANTPSEAWYKASLFGLAFVLAASVGALTGAVTVLFMKLFVIEVPGRRVRAR